MKRCTYCGKECSDDFAACPTDQRPLETIQSYPVVNLADIPELPAHEEEDLVPDRPKLVIVAGIWLIYGSGLILNIVVFSAVLAGALPGPVAPLCLVLAIACGALCAYQLNRVVKNYRIQRKRASDEMGR